MEIFYYFIFLVFFLIGFISSFNDIKYRKVPNQVNFLFFFYSCLIFFIFSYFNFSLEKLIFIIFLFLLSFLFFFFNIWGAGDGKFFLSESILLISLFSFFVFFDFLINLFIIYSLAIIFISFFNTTKKRKLYVLKNKIDFSLILFQTLFVIAIGKLFYFILSFYSISFFLDPVFFLIFLIFILSNPLKNIYKKLDLNEKIVINFLLFSICFFVLVLNFFTFLLYVLFIKIFIQFISELSGKIHSRHYKTYNSPFVLYLFLAGVFTFITKNNIFSIILSFI